MYFFNQVRHNVNNANRNGSVNYIDVDDIWNDCHTELTGEYDLPPLHLWEDGFCQGYASLQELLDLEKRHPELIKDIDLEGEHSPDFEGLDEKFTQIYEERSLKAIEGVKSLVS